MSGSAKGRWHHGIWGLEAMQRAASAPKLHLRYSEEGLCFPRSRLKEKAGLLIGVSQGHSSLWGITE